MTESLQKCALEVVNVEINIIQSSGFISDHSLTFDHS